MKTPTIDRLRSQVLSIHAFRRLCALGIVLGFGVGPMAAAVTPPSAAPPASTPPPPSAPAPANSATPSADPSSDLLSEQTSDLEALGVTLRVPKRAIVERLAGGASYRIDDSNEPPRFLVRAQRMVASASTSSPEEQFAQHQRFLVEKGQEFTILRDVDLSFDASPAKLAYLSVPLGEGVTAVTGWLLIQTGPNTFIAFSIITSGVDFAEAEALLAASFSTISLRGLEATAAKQATKLERTQKFLASLTPQKLRSVADEQPRWFRLYRPGSGRDGSDLEVGFLRIRSFEGERGEVSTSSTASSLTQPEKGLMVEVIAKLLVDGNAAHMVDVQSRCWQSWDRQTESWSTVSTERAAKQTVTWGQTGWRSRPMSTNEQGSILTVINSQPSKAVNNEELLRSRQPAEWEVPEVGYINQAEMILLGSLLPRDASLDGDFAFYCYDSRTNKLSQRTDRWTRDADGSGRHTLISRPSADGAEMKQLFGANGERLRRIDADGLVTELIEHQDLLRLWKSKGIPTG